MKTQSATLCAMSPTELEKFNQLVAALYRGAHETPRWQDFLAQLSGFCDASQSTLGLSRPRPGYGGVVFTENQPVNGDRFAYGAVSSMDTFVQLPDGKAMTMHEISSQQELEDNLYYTEFMVPRDYAFVLGMDIYQEDEVAMYIRLVRGADSQDFSGDEKAILNLLAPHFKNLVLWLDSQEKLSAEKNIYEGFVSHLAMGMVVLNHDGDIERMNPIAEFLLAAGDGLYVENNRLCSDAPGISRALKEFLTTQRKARHGAPAINQSLSIPRKNSETPLYMVIKQQPSGEFASDSMQGNAIVFINAAEMHVEGSENALQDMLGLTKTESHIAIELANGLTVAEIAEKTQVSVNTVRTHVARIFQKTAVNRQTALVSLVLKCIASLD